MILPDPYEFADTLALYDGDTDAALEAHELPADLTDPALIDLVAEARTLALAAARRAGTCVAIGGPGGTFHARGCECP